MKNETKKSRQGRSAKKVYSPESQVLKKLRADKNLSMREVADIAGCSDTFISFLENGRAEIPKTEVFDKILKVYEISRRAFDERVRRHEYEEGDEEFIIKAFAILKPDQKNLIKSLIKQYLATPPPRS